MAKQTGIYNANKNCKSCKGRGFVFEAVNYCSLGWGLKARNEKVICKKCHGRGFKL